MPPTSITLVHHCPTGDSGAFWCAAKRVLKAAPDSELRLVSPYLGHTVLRPLIGERRFRLITDLRACFEASADEALVGFLGANLASVRSRDQIHAKLLLSDRAALFGSANLTGKGFEERDELGCLVEEPALVQQLARWFEALWELEPPLDREALDAAMQRGRDAQRTRASAPIPEPKVPSASRGNRSLGRLPFEAANAAAIEASPDGVAVEHTADEELERADLVAHVQRLATSREQAAQVLALMTRALEVAGLGVDDLRLHLNFGNTPIHVTVGKRYVIWWGLKGRPLEVGFLLDNEAVAEAAASTIEKARIGWFSNPKTPGLDVPTAQLDAIPSAVFASWERAIRVEVDRRNQDGSLVTSNHREKKRRPYLYRALMEPALRREIVERAFPSTGCWWFGVNNGPGGHVQLDAMQAFLGGEQPEFTWNIGNSKPKSLYADMRRGDRVLIWTGHGRSPTWGLLGTASLAEVREEASS
jgi:hypothetical protein